MCLQCRRPVWAANSPELLVFFAMIRNNRFYVYDELMMWTPKLSSFVCFNARNLKLYILCIRCANNTCGRLNSLELFVLKPVIRKCVHYVYDALIMWIPKVSWVARIVLFCYRRGLAYSVPKTKTNNICSLHTALILFIYNL